MSNFEIRYDNEETKILGEYLFLYNHGGPDFAHPLVPHQKYCYVIYRALSEGIDFFVENNTYKLNKGDMIICSPFEIQKPVYILNGYYEREFIHFKREFLSDISDINDDFYYAFEKRIFGTNNMIPNSVASEYKLDELINKIKALKKSDLTYKKALIQSYLIQLVDTVNHIIKINQKKFIEKNKPINIVSLVIDYINKNITKNINLQNIEDEFHFNKYYLSHMFKEKTGYAIKEYIVFKKIMYAQHNILSGLSIQAAFLESGFEDYSGFYKSFKKITKQSPREFLVNNTRKE